MRKSQTSSFFAVRLFYFGAAKQIVNADTVKIRKLHKNINGIIQNTDFVLRIGVLLYVEVFGNLSLSIAAVNPKVSYVFKFK